MSGTAKKILMLHSEAAAAVAATVSSMIENSMTLNIYIWYLHIKYNPIHLPTWFVRHDDEREKSAMNRVKIKWSELFRLKYNEQE